jgi:DNA-binding transcriptional MocR family regulator
VTTNLPPDDRRVGGPHLARILGDWRGNDAAYTGLASRIRLLVLDGRLPLHTRLPAERELADTLEVSRTTVAAAYERLRADGYLRSRRGAGTWTDLPTTGRQRGPAPRATLSADDVIDLAHAAPSAPVEVLHQAADAAVAQLARYLPTHGYDPLGLAPLRIAVADRYSARGLPTTPDQIIVTSGAQSAFALVLSLLASPGDRVLVEHPTYPNVLDAIARAGCRAVPVGFTGTGWDLEMLATTFRQAAPRLGYLIPDFHNPTGRCMNPAQRRELVELAQRTRTPLVIDETVAELGLDHPAPPPVAVHDSAGMVITTGSTSKTFWGGLRIGWLRAPAAMIRRVAAVRASADLASPVFEQLATVELLRHAEETIALRQETFRERRDHLVNLVRTRLPGWRVSVPPGGLSLWVDLGAPISSALAVAAERYGVQVSAGPRFGLDGAFEQYLRLPYTLPTAELDSAVERLAAAAASVPATATAVAPVGDLV